MPFDLTLLPETETHSAPACPLVPFIGEDEESIRRYCAQGQCGIHGCPGGDCSDSPSLDLRIVS